MPEEPVPKPVNIHEAKTHFSRLIARVLKGEEVVIARSGVPVARLVPVARRRGDRIPGRYRGQIWESPDCWDPDPEVEALFGGEEEGAGLRPGKVAEGDSPLPGGSP